MTDLEKAGLIGNTQDEGQALPDEMMDEQFLDSPLGKIMQALAGLEMAAKAFEARIAQCETYVTYLLSHDPIMGPKIQAISKASLEAQKAQNEGRNDGKAE